MSKEGELARLADNVRGIDNEGVISTFHIKVHWLRKGNVNIPYQDPGIPVYFNMILVVY